MSGQTVDEVVALVLPSGVSTLANATDGEGVVANRSQVDDPTVGYPQNRPSNEIDSEFATFSQGVDDTIKSDAVVIPKLAVLHGAAAAEVSGPPKPLLLEDIKFHPNIINTVVFLVSTTMQACTVRSPGLESVIRPCASSFFLLHLVVLRKL